MRPSLSDHTAQAFKGRSSSKAVLKAWRYEAGTNEHARSMNAESIGCRRSHVHGHSRCHTVVLATAVGKGSGHDLGLEDGTWPPTPGTRGSESEWASASALQLVNLDLRHHSCHERHLCHLVDVVLRIRALRLMQFVFRRRTLAWLIASHLWRCMPHSSRLGRVSPRRSQRLD